MYALKQEVVNTNPNLVLYSIMFGELGDEVFTVDDLKRELAEHNADAISQCDIDRSIRRWLKNECLYREYNGYRIARA